MYIREAHPDSVLFTFDGGKEVLSKITQASSAEARAENAKKCLATLKLSIPAVVDGDDNRVNREYAGWPDRMYVVGRDGKIAYRGEPGPWGFRPNEVENWLKNNVALPPQPMSEPKSQAKP